MDEEDLDEEAEDAAQIEEIEIEAMEAEVLLILWKLQRKRGYILAGGVCEDRFLCLLHSESEFLAFI